MGCRGRPSDAQASASPPRRRARARPRGRWRPGAATARAPGRARSRRGEDRDRQRRAPLEALDQRDAAAELRPLVVERERGLRRDREPELPELPGEREHRHRQALRARPSATTRPAPSHASVESFASGKKRQRREGSGQEAVRAKAGQPMRDRAAEAPARGARLGPRRIAPPARAQTRPSNAAAASAAPGTPARDPDRDNRLGCNRPAHRAARAPGRAIP